MIPCEEPERHGLQRFNPIGIDHHLVQRRRRKGRKMLLAVVITHGIPAGQRNVLDSLDSAVDALDGLMFAHLEMCGKVGKSQLYLTSLMATGDDNLGGGGKFFKLEIANDRAVAFITRIECNGAPRTDGIVKLAQPTETVVTNHVSVPALHNRCRRYVIAEGAIKRISDRLGGKLVRSQRFRCRFVALFVVVGKTARGGIHDTFAN
mmetsp:Transcript_19542/g.42158  ORF Transcript_19542/g.42158 Transcript_19542/m.42158 type:complete len:206 (-) Transcript_19542:188-805(-)